MAIYANVPSITGYPVWFGEIDRLLEPFAGELDDAELRFHLRRFWVLLDRMFPDVFAHANLGPADGRVARAALQGASPRLASGPKPHAQGRPEPDP